MLCGRSDTAPAFPDLRRIVSLGDSKDSEHGIETLSYSTFISKGHSVFVNDSILSCAESQIRPGDVLNLQFTSGKSVSGSHHHLLVF